MKPNDAMPETGGADTAPALRAAILTISDKGSSGKRTDESGPALERWLRAHGVVVSATAILADEHEEISKTLAEWADKEAADLIVTTGGTGVSPRDVTPEATTEILDREIPGIAEAMRAASLAKTPRAILSRAVCGIRHRSLILNLPGSPAGAVENLEAVWAALPHAIRKLQGDASDCTAAEQ
jgi:molybdopterin adenylyltransferase